MVTPTRFKILILAVALALYAASLPTPALQFDGVENGVARIMKGYEVALLGWQAIFVGNLGWLANPTFLVSLLFVRAGNWRPALVCSAIALLLALQSLMLIGRKVIGDEGGVTHMVLSHLHAGFFLWIAAIALVVVSSLRARSIPQ